MQKLARRATGSFSEENAPVSSSDIPVQRMFDDSINNTPTGTPQARGDCDTVIKHGRATDQVLRSCESTIPKDSCSRQVVENSVSGSSDRSCKTLANGSEVDQPSGKRRQNLRVSVLNMRSEPLMPTSPARARCLLEQRKAIVVRRTPFVIKLLYTPDETKQPITLGIDPGQTIGFSAVVDNGVTKKELISGELKLRTDISELLDQRRNYRAGRRSRLWHRKERRDNRKRRKGRFPPSIQHGIDSHVFLLGVAYGR